MSKTKLVNNAVADDGGIKVMSKTKKIVIVSVAIFVLLATITLLALFIPRTGKKIVDIWAPSQEFKIDKIEVVEKEVGKDFKILLMTDLQLWTNLGDNNKVFKLMDELVAKTAPSLIILPGDNVSGITTAMLTRQLIKKMDSYGVPWAPIFGNHDSEGNATLRWQADRFAESKNCLFSRGPSNLYGVGNYFLNIKEAGEVIYSLALMDNGRYIDYGGDIGKKEKYVGYEQIAWYNWNVDGIAKASGTTVPSMVFTHFAQPEFKTAMDTLGVQEADKRIYVPEAFGFGSCKYLPGVAPVNCGFFDTAKERGMTHMFSGHDHENDASILYNDVVLTYGLKTGVSPRPWNDALQYGGTVVTLAGGNVNIANTVMQTVNPK